MMDSVSVLCYLLPHHLLIRRLRGPSGHQQRRGSPGRAGRGVRFTETDDAAEGLSVHPGPVGGPGPWGRETAELDTEQAVRAPEEGPSCDCNRGRGAVAGDYRGQSRRVGVTAGDSAVAHSPPAATVTDTRQP